MHPWSGDNLCFPGECWRGERGREGGRACWEKYQCRGLAGVSVERGVPVVQTDYSQVIYIPSLDCLVILPACPVVRKLAKAGSVFVVGNHSKQTKQFSVEY